MTRLEKALMLLRDLNTTRVNGDRYQERLVDLMLTELDDERGYKRGLDRVFGDRAYYMSRRQKRALKP
jgi:hypothetical protein